jgi:hypothetical protein
MATTGVIPLFFTVSMWATRFSHPASTSFGFSRE